MPQISLWLLSQEDISFLCFKQIINELIHQNVSKDLKNVCEELHRHSFMSTSPSTIVSIAIKILQHFHSYIFIIRNFNSLLEGK
jgi:hypothetical protein